MAQFHSPAWNERNDEYGGNIRNQARLTMEIISGIKNRLPEMPVICRLNGREYGAEEFFGTPGLTLKDALEIAKLIEASGADAVHISAFGWGMERTRNAPTSAGALLPLTEAIKKVISVPVIALGRILPEVGEAALREGKADFIAIGRGLLADPHLAVKLFSGDVEDIAPCITCYECLGEPRINICSVNARDGEEGNYPYPLSKAPKSKKVIVIGGGPGGMEAARVAAIRGHDVTLYEKEKELGGKLLVADKPSSKKNIRLLNPYLQRQLEKAQVAVELGWEATVESILVQRPEAVIIATGAKQIKPDINGLEKANVVDAVELLAGKAEVGN
ncbi:FAD-dependent oxidoreductase [Chloroflexota bacterium]